MTAELAQRQAAPLLKRLGRVDYLVALAGTEQSPALDGRLGNADRLKQRIEEQLRVSVLIEETAGSANPVYRVQVGPIASVELADHLSQRLDRLGIKNPHVVIR